ncbi:hypothetical protein A3J90_06765 [candidate division WOR-1 bacterium RIFOXYC2_FULL_37_10]|uniref:CzcB-like barrel-sandwich hybrid domain-containing protein n=1 Tax=candidate division WOR-1 bacterium RIFOXYB2_FULL_37_13 TaxID=1802579 RepID=A0A1F4SSH2_UNCSA|nr:MAG: hypothetical protein A2246_02535 [candidate division WOR-1 bacterium RIFOXYA2_FULL_37_7]OGC23391.1 MAG: hypothetical protein A2310_05035 [candidate division WOR-1 bacterium RIFOXYB2_FULL_37_13]OGC35504.1 MAG: hypothetical protein A3J90_06765 [candidate division WOR-1 bacterium RIFOXYC2_FULL_37_10]
MKIRSVFLGILLLAIGFTSSSCNGKPEEPLKKIKVQKGTIKAQIQSTGIVEPRNRLEIKPPLAGRIDNILVVEGQNIRKGQIIAYMSSSDRAALLDAARAKGEEEVKHWEDVYKPTPIIAPLNGFVIQKAIEPGQTVTAADPIIVMADHLIVKAQVDETDLASISLNQKVSILLDAYSDKQVFGRVEHIAYESTVINNVTIYDVNVIPNSVPSFFRAGMSATVNFILGEKKDILMLPLNAIKKIGDRVYVFVESNNKGKTKYVQIQTGLEDNLNIEIISGLSATDEVVIPTAKMLESLQSRSGRRGPINPFAKKK